MMVAAQVVGNDSTIAWANAMGSSFELNVMMPVMAYNLLQSIDLLANAAGHLVDKCIDVAPDVKVFGNVRGVEAEPERCADLIERSLAMCTALAPRIGYDAAAAIAKKSFATGKFVRQVALDFVGKTPTEVAAILELDDAAASILLKTGVPSGEEITRLLDPYSQTVRGTGVGGSGGG